MQIFKRIVEKETFVSAKWNWFRLTVSSESYNALV